VILSCRNFVLFQIIHFSHVASLGNHLKSYIYWSGYTNLKLDREDFQGKERFTLRVDSYFKIRLLINMNCRVLLPVCLLEYVDKLRSKVHMEANTDQI
jgi:hypothetical protein